MTISIEMGIMQLLKTSANVFALIGDRIGPTQSINGPRPFVIYSRFFTNHEHHLGGASGLVFARIQLDCFADTVVELVDLVDAIRNRLDGFRGTVNLDADSITFQQVSLDDERTENIAPDDATDAGPQRHLLDFFVSAAESVPTLT